VSNPFENLLPLSRVAVVLGVSRERVRQLTQEGKLPSVETPLGRLYREQDVLRAAEKGWPGRSPNRARGGRARWRTRKKVVA
jgi:excisionase family DNA binding protein